MKTYKITLLAFASLLLLQLNTMAQNINISVATTGVNSMATESVGQVFVVFRNNSFTESFGPNAATVRVEFDARYFDVSAAATGLQDQLPTGWTVESVTQNATQSFIILSMGTDVIPAGTSRSFYVKFKSKTSLVTANLYTVGVYYPLNIPPTGDDQDDNDAESSITINSYLPVVFGPISATIKNGIFSLNWSTETEKNNSRFIIELSKDGKTFVAVDSVKTQAVNGLSDTPLQYTYCKEVNTFAKMMGWNLQTASFILLAAIVIVLFILMVKDNNGQQKTKLLILLVVCISAFTLFACRKQQEQSVSYKDMKVWVRITQVDIDGTRISSKVVQAVNE